MRIYLKLSRNKETIPFNYQTFLTGAIHKWIGKDNYFHDAMSLYSFSWLQQVEIRKVGIGTTKESYFFIAAYNDEVIRKIMSGIVSDPSVCFGMSVSEVQMMKTPVFSRDTLFYTASPVFIKRQQDGHENHILYSDPEAGSYLTETIKKKLRLVGLPEDGVTVDFDRTFPSAKSKVIYYGRIGNKVNICPVRIQGSADQVAFAWNVGIGNSTGIGFGALK